MLLGLAYTVFTSPVLSGEVPQLANGPKSKTFTMTYRSQVDDSLQPLLAKTPAGYNQQEKWPLLVVLHGAEAGPLLVDELDGMVQVGPFGRGSVEFSGIGERDVFDCFELAQEVFSIDPTRTYLCGFSMGANAVFSLGLRYPELWAACVPVCGGKCDLGLLDNARDSPFWIHTGAKDIRVSPTISRQIHDQALKVGLKHWKFTEHKDMGHDFDVNWPQVKAWLLQHQRIDANIQVQRPVKLSGPLWDVYTSRCVLIYGTHTRKRQLIKAAKQCAEAFSDPLWMGKVAFRIVPDLDVTPRDIAENNMVLFGNSSTNTVLQQVSPKLSMSLQGNTVQMKGQQWQGKDIGLVLIQPNPLNPRKYVAVFAGNTARSIDCFHRIWPRFNSVPRDLDYGIFQIDLSTESVKWLCTGVFE